MDGTYLSQLRVTRHCFAVSVGFCLMGHDANLHLFCKDINAGTHVTANACARRVRVQVQKLKGVRATVVGSNTVRMEYLAQWKDGSPDTWEEGACG